MKILKNVQLVIVREKQIDWEYAQGNIGSSNGEIVCIADNLTKSSQIKMSSISSSQFSIKFKQCSHFLIICETNLRENFSNIFMPSKKDPCGEEAGLVLRK